MTESKDRIVRYYARYKENSMNRKKIYCDVRKRYSDRASDADIIVALEVENNILTGKYGYLQAENDNLRRMYTELIEKYKALKVVKAMKAVNNG